MPVTADEFAAGERNLKLALTWFLRAHSGLGYSPAELLPELFALGFEITLLELSEALEELTQNGRLLRRDIRGTLYYIYDRTLGFRPSRR